MRSLYRRLRWRLRKRRRVVVAAGAIVLIAVVVYLLIPGPDLRAGSKALPDGPVDVASTTPRAYEIVYRVESRAGDDVVVSTDRVWVRRPFSSRIESWTDAPPGSKRTSITINSFARIRFGDTVFAAPPAPAPQDRRVDSSLREVVRSGYAWSRERRRVAGRICRVYRTGGEGGSGSLVRLAKSPKSYTDVCLDEAGLALEEATFLDRRLVSRRVAVRVDTSPHLTDAMFRTGKPTLPVRQGGGSVREVEPSSRSPGTFWEMPRAPKGFARKGRYAVIPPQEGFDDPTKRSQLIAFTSDVWVDGVDVVVIEQGSTLGGIPPFGADPNARRVRVGALGRGELIYGLGTSEVRVLRKGGRFVRVVGTVEPSRLLAIARSLQEKPGGELVYLDELPS